MNNPVFIRGKRTKIKMIYMDNAASEKPLPCAVRAFNKVVKKHYANPHSAHRSGMESKAILEQARETIAECINCRPNEVYFTSGATEACNWAIQIMASRGTVTSYPTAHAAVTEKIDSYRFDIMARRTYKGFCYTLVNNETGAIEARPITVDKDELVLCDATAAVGNIPVNFRSMGVDYMAFGAHKFGGIPGIGCLIVRESAPIEPFLYGGGEKYRAGTPCVALAAAMAAALKYRTKTQERRNAKAAKMRYILLTEGLRKRVRDMKYYENTLQAPNILSLTFDGVDGSALVAMMSEKFGTMISTGAACNSGEHAPSKVLLAHGYTEGEAKSTVRLSISEHTTKRECRRVVKQLAYCVKHLRNF